MLPEPSRTFFEPPVMSAHLFLISNIPIRNPGSVHPQARLGLTFASDTPTLVLLAVHRLAHVWGPLETSHVAPERVRACHPGHVHAAIPQGELAAAEGPEEPEVPDPVLASSALPPSRSKFSFHGVSRQFLLLTTQHYCLRLIHQ